MKLNLFLLGVVFLFSLVSVSATLYPYFNDTPTSLYINVSLTAWTPKTIYIYNNTGFGLEYAPNGSNVFLLFDDFNSASLNTNLWREVSNAGSYSLTSPTSGVLNISSTGAGYIVESIHSKANFTLNTSLIFRGYSDIDYFYRSCIAYVNTGLAAGSDCGNAAKYYDGITFADANEGWWYVGNDTVHATKGQIPTGTTVNHIYTVEKYSMNNVKMSRDSLYYANFTLNSTNTSRDIILGIKNVGSIVFDWVAVANQTNATINVSCALNVCNISSSVTLSSVNIKLNTTSAGNLSVSDAPLSTISFVSPSDINKFFYLPHDGISVNVSSSVTNFQNQTIYLYNSSGLVSSSFSSSPNQFVNFTGLGNGTYYYNVSVFNSSGYIFNSTTITNTISFASLNISTVLWNGSATSSLNVTVSSLNRSQVNSFNVAVLLNTKNSGGSPLGGVLCIMRSFVNGSIVTVQSGVADASGRIQFAVAPNKYYDWNCSLSGYVPYFFSLDPVLFSSYDVPLSPLVSGVVVPSGYASFSPNSFRRGTSIPFNITFFAPYGSFTNYSFNVSFPTGSVAGSGSSPFGSSLNSSFSINNVGNVTIFYQWFLSNGVYQNFTQSYRVINVVSNRTVSSSQGNYGLLIGDLVLRDTVILIVLMGLGWLAGGFFGSLAMGGLTLGIILNTGAYSTGQQTIFAATIIIIILLIIFRGRQ